MTESKTPRTDALGRNHYYEASAEAAGMIVSAKSPEDCYLEAMALCGELERELAGKTSKVAELEKLVERLENELMGRE